MSAGHDDPDAPASAAWIIAGESRRSRSTPEAARSVNSCASSELPPCRAMNARRHEAGSLSFVLSLALRA